MSPLHKRYGCFSFTHVYRRHRRDTLRLTHGFVLGLPETIYMIGLSAPKPPDGKLLPLGVKAIAVPNESLEADQRCVSGLFLSNAARWQPIIGRVSMLHMGLFSVAGELNHEHANIRLIDDPQEVRADIAAHCQQHGLGSDQQDIDSVTKRVLDDINNCPLDARRAAEDEGVLQALGIDHEDD
jgi:hypothetical protein